MKYYIEEAVIIETFESEPKLTTEPLQIELLSERKKRKQRRFGGLLSSFFDDLLGRFFDNNDDGQEEDPIKPIEEPVVPEIALIVETNEVKVTEIQYFYAEIIN